MKLKTQTTTGYCSYCCVNYLKNRYIMLYLQKKKTQTVRHFTFFTEYSKITRSATLGFNLNFGIKLNSLDFFSKKPLCIK